MSETPTPTAIPGLSLPESERMQIALKEIAERSQKLLAEFAERYKADGRSPSTRCTSPRPSWTSPPR